jgi:hypothetical protein
MQKKLLLKRGSSIIVNAIKKISSCSKIAIMILVLLFTFNVKGQTVNSESFDLVTFVPTGWINLNTTTGNTWTRVTTGTTPTCTTHSGAGMAKFNSYSANSGVRSIITPSYSLIGNTSGANVSFWLYRDASSTYASSTDKIDVYYNTATANLTGALLLGTVNRSTTLSPTVSLAGWYQYSFTIPGTVKGTTNYLILKATSAWGDNVFIDDVSWTSYPTAPSPCSGTPTPGNTIASVNPVVSGGTSVLSLQNTTGSGATYQWQSSSDNITFANIGGATASTYTATVTANTYYRCLVTCSVLTGTATSVLVSLSYCASTYANGPGTSDQITNVSLGLLSNTTGASASPYYNFYNALTIPDLQRSNTASIAVTVGSNTAQYVAVWIDFNQDWVFQTSEGVVSGNLGANGTATLSLAVPAGAILGNTRMRVRGGNDIVLTTAQSCGASSSTYGETEDYIVNITVAPTCLQPTALTTSAITPTTATLSWTAAVPAPSNGYQWEVRTSGAGGSGGAGLTTSGSTLAAVTTANATGLTANTTYTYYVRSSCGGADYSAWESSSSFYTGYCASIGSSATYYINNFSTTLGSTNITNNSSGYSVGGYQNATTMVVSQYANATVNFSTSFDTGGIYTYGFAIFVDWNNNLNFDLTEKVFSTTSYVTSQTGSFSVPIGQAIGNYRMRIVANYNSTGPTPCNTPAISGETEDYTFTVVTVPTCLQPTALTTSAITTTTATLSWTAAVPAPSNGYQWEVRTSGAGGSGGTGLTSSGSTLAAVTTTNATGLAPNTTYYYYVRSFCGGIDYSAWASSSSFYTGYCASTSTNQSTYISNFSITSGVTTFNNNTLGTAGGYADYSSIKSCSQYIGATSNLSYTLVGGTAGVNVWVDWNDNLSFADPGEFVVGSGGYIGSGTYTSSITVPALTAIGSHRMRIVTDYNSTNPLSCASITRGETEDYTFTVIALTPPAITIFSPAYGCVGSTITITGTNFTGATAVTIGLTAVSSITSITATQIVAVVGSGTTGTVKVTTPGGTGTSGSTFTVNPLPTAVTVATAGTYCASTTLTASGGTGGTIYWQGVTPNGTSTTTSSSSQLVSASGTYYFRAQSAFGCWGTQGSADVVIITPITITTQPATATQSTCLNGTAFTALTVAATGATPTYQWYSNTTNASTGGTSIGGATSVSYTPLNTATGTKYYYCIVSGVSPCTAVTSAASGAITVNTSPTVLAITGASTVCPLGIITLSNSTPSGVWSVINGTGTASIISITGVLTGLTVGTVTVYYTVTTNGCSTAVNFPVTISAGPIITTQPISVAIAAGANTSFSIVAAGSTSYSWQVSTDGGSTWSIPITNSAPYSTATTNSLNITGATALMNGYKYRATATNTCGITISSTGTLSIIQTTLVPYTGNNAILCGTSTSLSDHAGTSDYSNNADGYTVLENSGTGIITLNGSYVTELNYDYIYIYAGIGTSGTLLYTYHGTGNITQVVSAAGQSITVQFTSDGSKKRAGFNFSVVYSGTCAVCGNAASNLTTSAITSTTATLSWTAGVPAPSDGYQWEVRTSGVGGSVGVGLTASGSTLPGITTTNITGLTPNTTYYYYVRNSCGGGIYSTWASSSSFTTLPTPPINNLCANASSLPCGTTALAGTTFGAIATGVTGCSMSNYGVWYSFAGDGNSTTVSTTGTAGFDQEMAIMSGSCSSYSTIACQDNAGGGGTESATFTSVIGLTYYVYVAYYGTGTTTGTFNITRTCIIPPVNNLCANATALTCGTTAMAGTTVGANTSSFIQLTGACGMGENGVWYTFVGDGNSTTISTTTTGFDQQMNFMTGSCGTYTTIKCQDGTSGSGTESYTFTTVSGTTYYVYVAYYVSGTTTGTFTISRSCPPLTPCVTPITQPSNLVLSAITITSMTGNFTAAVPTPSNYLVVANTTGIAPTLVNGTNYAIGSTILGNTNMIIDTDANTTFTSTGLLGSTKYYYFVFSYSSTGCTGGSLYLSLNPLTNSATTLSPTYCTPSVSSSVYTDLVYFTNISFVGTLNDTSNPSTFTTTATWGYQNFTGLATKAIQAQGQGVNISVQTSSRGYLKAWVDWNKDGVFANPEELVYNAGDVASYSTTFGFVIPSIQPVGDYRIRVRINKDDATSPYDAGAIYTFNPCQELSYYGETEDYLFTVTSSCAAVITSVTNGQTCGTGTVNLAATGSAGVTSFKWYATATGGTAIPLATTGAYTTNSISATTTYYVTAVNGCESLVRTAVIATINPIPTLNFTPTNPIVCGENTIISLTAAGDKQQTYLINENFESGGLGAFSKSNYNGNGATINGYAAWQNKSSTYVPVKPPGQVWFPAISSGFGTNKFVTTTSDLGDYIIHTGLVSNTLNSTNYTNLTLTFDEYYSRYYVDGTSSALDYFTIDVSVDGGTTWIPLENQTSDVAIGTRFLNKSFNLNSYINQTNLKIRFRYYGEWCDGVAIDNVKLFGDIPLNTAFNWTSSTPVDAYTDAACTTSYVAGTPALTVYVKPSLVQLELGTFNFIANAILSNGCSVGQPITVTNNSKIWQGVTTNWNSVANWKPWGVPTADSCVIIPNTTIISGTSFDAFAKNLTVKPTGNLEVAPGNNITVTNWVNVNTGGIFYVRNNASLVQINNDVNTVTGIFKMERTTQPMKRTAYTYWNSPVKTGTFTLGALSAGSIYYSWTPSINNSFGNWQGLSATTIMDHQNGYIIRAPSTFSTTVATAFTGNFVGTPNNGDVFAPISYGTSASTSTDPYESKWNLIGNPYPSAINADLFLSNSNNAALIDGTIYLWTHNTVPSTAFPDPFYGDYAYNYTQSDYASYNRLGGTATAAANSGGEQPNGYIAAGMSFFTRSLAVTGKAIFTNAMRVTNNNTQFFRTTNSAFAPNLPFERHRIWLNLTNTTGAFSQILVGYCEGATLNMDRDFDGSRFGGNGVNFYSIIPEDILGIQGRPLPFDENDQVNLGYNATSAGTFSIRIETFEGLFNYTNVFIEDKLLNVIFDIKTAPYVFTTASGTFNDRFVLRYTDSALGTGSISLDNSIKVVTNDKAIVYSSNQAIKNIEIFDVLGRKIDSYKNVNANQITLSHLTKTMNALFVKITLENGVIVNKKIIF